MCKWPGPKMHTPPPTRASVSSLRRRRLQLDTSQGLGSPSGGPAGIPRQAALAEARAERAARISDRVLCRAAAGNVDGTLHASRVAYACNHWKKKRGAEQGALLALSHCRTVAAGAIPWEWIRSAGSSSRPAWPCGCLRETFATRRGRHEGRVSSAQQQQKRWCGTVDSAAQEDCKRAVPATTRPMRQQQMPVASLTSSIKACACAAWGPQVEARERERGLARK